MPNWKRVAARIAREEGIDPGVFVRQIRQESGFNPNAVSPAGARGIAQIMPDTAKGWGVDPMKPKAALRAAARNMRRYVKQYGSYEAALRAYNAGPGAIERSKGYRETNHYVSVILPNGEPGKLRPRAARPRRAGGGGGGGGPTTHKVEMSNPLAQGLLNESRDIRHQAVMRLVSSGGKANAVIGFASDMAQSKALEQQAEANDVLSTKIQVPGQRNPRKASGGGGRPRNQPKLGGGLQDLGRETDRLARRMGLPLGSHARSEAHNRAVGGSEDSDHVMERGGRWARDIPSTGRQNIAGAARIAERYGVKPAGSSGKAEGIIKVNGKRYRIQILDARYPGHDDHIHVGIRAV